MNRITRHGAPLAAQGHTLHVRRPKIYALPERASNIMAGGEDSCSETSSDAETRGPVGSRRFLARQDSAVSVASSLTDGPDPVLQGGPATEQEPAVANHAETPGSGPTPTQVAGKRRLQASASTTFGLAGNWEDPEPVKGLDGGSPEGVAAVATTWEEKQETRDLFGDKAGASSAGSDEPGPPGPARGLGALTSMNQGDGAWLQDIGTDAPTSTPSALTDGPDPVLRDDPRVAGSGERQLTVETGSTQIRQSSWTPKEAAAAS